MGSIQTISHKTIFFKIGVVLTASIGSIYAGNRLNDINTILGNQVLEEALKQYELLCRQDNQSQEFNKPKQFNNFIQKIDISLDIYEKRFRTYLNRFIHYDQYDKTNTSFVKNVARPILAKYESEGIFELKELLTELKAKGNFNNKLTAQLMKIAKLNALLKEKNKYQINDFFQLQQKLVTIAIPALSPTQKQKIDLIYDYIQAKNSKLSATSASKETSSFLKEPQIISPQDYLSKLSFL